MKRIRVTGGRTLTGSVDVQGSKNVFLHLAAASLLASGTVELRGVPRITDTGVYETIARASGADAVLDRTTMVIDARTLITGVIPFGLGRSIRPTPCIAAALLSRTGYTAFPAPGGDAFTTRRFDRHIAAMRAAGARVEYIDGVIHASLPGRPRGFELDVATVYGPSLGATVTAVLLAVTAIGPSIISGASVEPEVMHTLAILRRFGAAITWSGSDVIEVDGVEKLAGGTYRIPPDRMAAGTIALAAALTHGRVELGRVRGDAFPQGFVDTASATGVQFGETRGGVLTTCGELRSITLETAPHPGFPTDLQPQLCALLTQSTGTSQITERIYAERATHLHGLARLGARVNETGRHMTIHGPTRLRGATVHGADIRAATALLLAALVADGTTILTGVEHLKRGYEDLPGTLRRLGAHIDIEGDQ